MTKGMKTNERMDRHSAISNSETGVQAGVGTVLVSKKYMMEQTDIYGFTCNIYAERNALPQTRGAKQGWRSGESARLPPLFPGFNASALGAICWLSWSVRSLLTPRSRVFLVSSLRKPNISKFQFDQERRLPDEKQLRRKWLPPKILKFIYYLFTYLFGKELGR